MFKTVSRGNKEAWRTRGAGGSSRAKRVWFAWCCLLALSLIFSVLHGQCLAEDPDLVAYYPFNGDAKDASGNGHDGIICGNPTFTTTEDGRTIISLNKNGENTDYVQLPDETFFDLTEFTILVTIRVPDYSRNNWIISKGPSYGNFTMNIFGDGESQVGKAEYVHQCIVGSEIGNFSAFISEGAVPKNAFVKLAVTVSSSSKKFTGYYYGNIVASFNMPYSPVPNDSPVIIGAGGYYDLTSFFKGDIDEVKIYKRVLTAEEIKYLHGGNNPPTADAGPDQSLTLLNSIVTLQGTAFDPDVGQTLSYSWTFKSYSGTSEPELNDSTTLTPSFVAAAHGDYELELKVTDSKGASATDTVKISFNNLPPVADAGPDQVVIFGNPVYLYGVGSSDPNNDPLTYDWSFSKMPKDSQAYIFSYGEQVWFYPDEPGQYVVQLQVNDGDLLSSPDSADITVKVGQDDVTKKLEEAIRVINEITKEYWVNPSHQKTMVNKAVAVQRMAIDEQYAEAAMKIEKDIQPKLSVEEVLQKENVWITDPEKRKKAYDAFEVVKTYLKNMQ